MRVVACQTPEVIGAPEAALSRIEEFARQEADVLLFPECFLQGYLVTPAHLRTWALNLGGADFATILRRLGRLRRTLVFGVIEADRGRYYNSAVVTSGAELIGVYRKTHLVPGERAFEPGTAYPVFDLHGVRCGINICYDTRFPEAAAQPAAQGARVLLVPAQNMMRRAAAEHWKDRHNQIRKQRVRETGMWLISADVTGFRAGTHVGYGPTCVINPEAEIVSQVPLLTSGVALGDIE